MESGTEVTIKPGTTMVAAHAFDDCYDSLVGVSIPDSVTSIGASAFANTGLTSVSLPSGLVRIGSYAFLGCSSLTNVTFEDTSGWYIEGFWDNVEEKTIDLSINVTNPSTNATNLKYASWDEPSGYADNNWKKS